MERAIGRVTVAMLVVVWPIALVAAVVPHLPVLGADRADIALTTAGGRFAGAGPTSDAFVLAVQSEAVVVDLATAPAPAPEPARAAPPAKRAASGSQPVEAAPAPASDEQRIVSSTAYCTRGTTASGVAAGPGQVAMNDAPLGSHWHVLEGPMAGEVLVVTDRIGRGSQFDIWMSSCDQARTYGRHSVRIARVD